MQNTIKKAISISGIGIHSGKEVTADLLPAGEDSGIVFKTSDANSVEAKFDNVTSTNMSTKLSNGQCTVDVVEHLMAALWASNIDNLIIHLNSFEVPILDGSAIEWMKKIRDSGITQQSSKRKILKVRKVVKVSDDDKYVEISPNSKDGIAIDLSIHFEHPAIGIQQILFDGNLFEERFAPARTFGFMKDLEYLHRNGLGLGASLENCIGIDESGIVNPEGLRFDDEFVRHKVLDCIGDLFLSGYHLNCKIRAHKTGHKLNNMVLRKMFEDPENYIIE
jgi:UDP-3-O-[3-hydroxymyristoyl] N-acetylglucosamine deacetylase